MRTFTDQEIVEGLRQRNPALTEAIVTFLYHHCQPSVTWMVLQNSGSRPEADDLFQEVILAFLHNVWEGQFELRPSVAVKTYVCDVARLQWLRQLRSNGSRSRRENEFGQTHNEPLPLIDDGPFEGEPDQTALAWRVFNRLDERCQLVLTAFYLDKKSLQQIAELFGYSSAEYAKLVKYRCLQNLKKLIHQP